MSDLFAASATPTAAGKPVRGRVLVSEKAAEILFHRYLLQTLGLREAQLFAPTTSEERQCGYDGSISGLSSAREVYLQFKAVKMLERRGDLQFELTRHQHEVLLRFEPEAALYVVPMFPSLAAFLRAQQVPKTAADFLKHYLCIPVHAFPLEADRIRFEPPEDQGGGRLPVPALRWLAAGAGRGQDAERPVHDHGVFRAHLLPARMERGESGVIRLHALTPPGDSSLEQVPAHAASAPSEALLKHGTGGYVRYPLNPADSSSNEHRT